MTVFAFWSIIFLFSPRSVDTIQQILQGKGLKVLASFRMTGGNLFVKAQLYWSHTPAPKGSSTPVLLQCPSKHFVILCQSWRWVSIINSCIFWPLSWCEEHLRGCCLSLHSLSGAIIDQRVWEISWAFYVRGQADVSNCLHSVYTCGNSFHHVSYKWDRSFLGASFGNIFLNALASDKLLCEVIACNITVHLISNDVSHTCHHGASAAVLLARPRRITRVHQGC